MEAETFTRTCGGASGPGSRAELANWTGASGRGYPRSGTESLARSAGLGFGTHSITLAVPCPADLAFSPAAGFLGCLPRAVRAPDPSCSLLMGGGFSCGFYPHFSLCARPPSWFREKAVLLESQSRASRSERRCWCD